MAGEAWPTHRPGDVQEDDQLRRSVARQTLTSKELPLFSGDPEDWLIFAEQFRTSTTECHFTHAGRESGEVADGPERADERHGVVPVVTSRQRRRIDYDNAGAPIRQT